MKTLKIEKKNFFFLNKYKMFKISAKTWENSGVHTRIIKK